MRPVPTVVTVNAGLPTTGRIDTVRAFRVDEGGWQAATIDASHGKYSWKLFTFDWTGATPGEHTLVSRATDVDGTVRPTAEELAGQMTFLEDP